MELAHAQPLWSLWRPLHSTLNSLLFREMVRNRIPRVCFYFCSTERNSEFFLFRWRAGKGIPRVCLNRMEFWVVCSSAEGFGTEFRGLSVLRNSRNSVGNIHLFRLFRLPRNYFFVGNSQPNFQASKRRIGSIQRVLNDLYNDFSHQQVVSLSQSSFVLPVEVHLAEESVHKSVLCFPFLTMRVY
jgi:hypothetical protein